MSRPMARWVVELSEFGIQYKPRLVMKGQALANFLVEVLQQETKSDNSDWWILNVDGALQQTRIGLGLQLEAPIGEII